MELSSESFDNEVHSSVDPLRTNVCQVIELTRPRIADLFSHYQYYQHAMERISQRDWRTYRIPVSTKLQNFRSQRVRELATKST